MMKYKLLRKAQCKKTCSDIFGFGREEKSEKKKMREHGKKSTVFQ